ncbi:D-alanyl-D-alanine carboxypeptidase-like protein [Mobilisporobacter senegalensis]|uniref:D-alanyl-D-alanine carboxypeptidase-like protein n=1 Tax=Mobilisporobacter senegalensis TaxID=1329262 RepID=A0A3N1XSD2_9FIRM|nr:serine hydrolase [Mobilisporobacter senegalensis]ROR29148.1 D-alanyl-D-alanine carboxypeptidase-like protein [Mobilisporobacter senegalensis]
MKKRVLCVLLTITLLTGCSNSSDAIIPYEDSLNLHQNNLVNLSNIQRGDLFAKDLTVISKDFNSPKDNNLNSLSSLLINVTDQETIYSNNVHERLYPASITKIATALVVLKHADLTETVTISKNASNITEAGAKLCGFKEGDQIVLKDLLTSLLVYSGNDAGIAIAEHVAGSVSAFADMMNEEVRKIGAVHTNFLNPHGLHDDDHYTTGYDLYLIFNELLQYQEFLDIIKLGEYTLTYKDNSGKEVKKEFSSTDRYLTGAANVPKGITVLGGKTGTTFKAGSCLILASKDKDDKVYISLVLKADSSDNLFYQMTYLLELISK